MLDVVRDGLACADDVRIAVSFTRCSGLGLLVDPIKELVARGGRVRVLTSTYQTITQPAALDTLHALSGVETRIQHGHIGFHAKFWWFKGQTLGQCWAGSSNLSKGGLATNLEWNLRSTDSSDMATTQSQFEQLWKQPDVIPISEEFILRYRKTYKDMANQALPQLSNFSGDTAEIVTPNDAQEEALGQLSALRLRGERRAAVIAATGVGKTYLAAFDVFQHGAKSVLYVSHRLEHLTQAMRSFSRVLGATHTFGRVGDGLNQHAADVVFATVASLKNRPALLQRTWDYLVIDEFHHAEASSYNVLRPIRDQAFLLGITATPERQDGRDVLEWCDWNVAYEVRLTEAIDRGWLLPFHYFGIADETVDFLQIPWRKLEAVESALSVESRVEQVLQHALERGYDGDKRSTVGFCAGRSHALYMTEQFNKRGHTAKAVLGDMSVSERETVYQRLADVRDPLEWIFVADVLNEGVDIPAINSVLFLRPTESSTLFLQQLGRGLRLCPGTEVLTVIDFVGHHRAAWLTLQALHNPHGGGRRTKITDDFTIKPPTSCEVVLQPRTREILAKVNRFTTKKAACEEAYQLLMEQLERSVMPIDLWNRNDVPTVLEFRAAYKTWLQCQEANNDAPSWSKNISLDHPVRSFLKSVESDWQAQRVWPYALLWGLCTLPDNPEDGYHEFFKRWPQWQVEQTKFSNDSSWKALEKHLGNALVGRRLAGPILSALGDSLLTEVEGRLLYTLSRDHQTRHGGVLRTPDELNLFAYYSRPEIVRFFGVHYDPARHNKGVLWFENQGAIITKLDTSSAVEHHQYKNRFLTAKSFYWTSQNQMKPTNPAGLKVLNAETETRTLRLFIQPRSHKPALYTGKVTVERYKGSGPTQIEFALEKSIPDDVLTELGVTLQSHLG